MVLVNCGNGVLIVGHNKGKECGFSSWRGNFQTGGALLTKICWQWLRRSRFGCVRDHGCDARCGAEKLGGSLMAVIGADRLSDGQYISIGFATCAAFAQSPAFLAEDLAEQASYCLLVVPGLDGPE